MFKLGMALMFAVIAALVVFLTGMFGDARVATAFLRSLIAFLCAGAFTYLVTYILEAKGWAFFDKYPAELFEDMQPPHYEEDDIDFDAVENGGTKAAEEFAEPTNFQPLSEDSFIHMKTPPAEGAEGAPAPA